MPSDSVQRSTPRLHTLPGVLIAVATYTLIHASTRLIASGNLGEDDPLDSLLAQTLQAGYSVSQGPLYDWLLWSVQHLVGTGLPGFLLIKYPLLIATAGGIFLCTRRLTGSGLWGFIAVESMAAVYQIFWRLHEGFTHRVLTMALVMCTLWLMLRQLDHARRRDALLLGLAIGAGLLSEHSYLYFLVALFLALAVDRQQRQQIFNVRQLALWLPGLLLTTPYLLWLTSESGRLSAWGRTVLPPLPATRHISASVYDAATYPFLVLSPYLLVAVLNFPRILRPLPTPDPAGTDLRRQSLKRLIGRTLAFEVFGIVVIGGIVWSYANYAVHLVLPMMVIALPWLTARIHDSRPTLRQIRRFMLILLIFTGAAYAMRSGNLFVWEPFCSRCRWGTPYPALAEQLRAGGFTGGTLVSDDVHTLGNLRRFFPDARFYLNGDQRATNEPNHGGQTLWLSHRRDLEDRAPSTAMPNLPGGPTFMLVPWHGPLKAPGYRQSIWEVRRNTP